MSSHCWLLGYLTTNPNGPMRAASRIKMHKRSLEKASKMGKEVLVQRSYLGLGACGEIPEAPRADTER